MCVLKNYKIITSQKFKGQRIHRLKLSAEKNREKNPKIIHDK